MKKSIFLLLIFIYLSLQINAFQKPAAKDGILSLNNWNFQEDGFLELKGEWDFYPQKFIVPQTLNNQNDIPKKLLLVPGMWGNPYSVNSEKNWKGYATAHLKVTGIDPSKIYVLKIEQFNTSYKLWIDEDEVIINGTIGTNQNESYPVIKTRKLSFQPKSEEFNITIQCSNYHDRFGTFSRNILLGFEKDIDKQIFTFQSIELIAFVILIGSIFWFIILFFITRVPALIYIPGISIGLIIRVIFEGERIIHIIIPDINSLITYKMLFGSYYVCILFFTLFCTSIFKNYYSINVRNILILTCCAFIIITIAGNIQIITTVVIFFHIVPFIMGFFLISAAIKAYKMMKKYTIYFLIGIIFVLGFVLNDIFVLSGFIKMRYLEPYILIIFILLHTFFFIDYGKKYHNSKKEIHIIFDKYNLSLREKDVALLLIKGLTNSQIATELFISGNTAKFHIKNIFQKSGVNNRNSFTHLFFDALLKSKTNTNNARLLI